MLNKLKVEDLKPGMLVAEVTKQSGPVKIRKIGLVRSFEMIKGLKEMGVEEVIIDASQTLEIEENLAPNAPETAADALPLTPTQRLMQVNKKNETAERNLSQQFHRALFLPAAEDMPSKFALYVTPFIRLTSVVVVGLLLGFSLTMTPSLVKSFSNTGQDLASFKTSEKPRTSKGPLASDSSPSSISDTTLERRPDSSPDSSPDLKISESDDGAGTQETVSSVINQQVTDPSNGELSNTAEESLSPSSEQVVSSAEKTSESTSTINGLALESGQTVLGYQASESIDRDYTENAQSSDDLVSNYNQNMSSNAIDNADPELMRRIQEAVEMVDSMTQADREPVLKVTDLGALPRIDQLSPAILTQLPAMSFSAHMYASNASDRWVRVNSQRLGEGDFISQDLQIIEIASELVILEYQGERFTMNALSDW